MTELATTIERETGISLFASSRFDLAIRQADMLSKSDLLPKAFHGNPANCLIALELAERINTSPFLVAQNVDVIHGKPGFSAKFLIGCFNSSGHYDPITYEETEADGGSCRAISRDRRTGTVIEGPWVSMKIAKAEGWVSKNGSKWQTMPQMMLRYRAASWMIRTTAPEISLGLPTSEEIIDTGGAMGPETARDVTPKNPFAKAQAEPKETVEETVEETPVALPAEPEESARESYLRDIETFLDSEGIDPGDFNAAIEQSYKGAFRDYAKLPDGHLAKLATDGALRKMAALSDRIKEGDA